MAGIPTPRDLDDALARPGLDAVIVGGPIESRGESLRRAAAEGLAHRLPAPARPGLRSLLPGRAEPRGDRRRRSCPTCRLRLHPGVTALRQALCRRRARHVPRPADGVASADPHGTEPGPRRFRPRGRRRSARSLGEVEALTATGDPPGEDPDYELVVQLRAAGSRRAEVRIRSRAVEPARLTLLAVDRIADPRDRPGRCCGRPRLIRHVGRLPGERRRARRPGTRTRPSSRCWPPRWAGTRRASCPRPNLLDGTRAMELSEAAGRSLPPRPDGRDPLRVDQRGGQLQVGHDLDRLHDLPRAAPRPAPRDGRPAARPDMDPLSSPTSSCPALVLFVLLQTLRLAIRSAAGATEILYGSSSRRRDRASMRSSARRDSPRGSSADGDSRRLAGPGRRDAARQLAEAVEALAELGREPVEPLGLDRELHLVIEAVAAEPPFDRRSSRKGPRRVRTTVSSACALVAAARPCTRGPRSSAPPGGAGRGGPWPARRGRGRDGLGQHEQVVGPDRRAAGRWRRAGRPRSARAPGSSPRAGRARTCTRAGASGSSASPAGRRRCSAA